MACIFIRSTCSGFQVTACRERLSCYNREHCNNFHVFSMTLHALRKRRAAGHSWHRCYVFHTPTTKDSVHFSAASTVIRHTYYAIVVVRRHRRSQLSRKRGESHGRMILFSGQICSCLLPETSLYQLINARLRRVIEILVVPWSSLLPATPLYFSYRALRYSHPQLFDHCN
jgi:hypothetical protein